MNIKPEFEKLFQPCKIGQMTLKNRIVMSPMGNNFGSDDGYVTDRQIAYYEERANGGTGLLITEMVSVDSPLGQRGAQQLRLDDDSYITGLNRFTRHVHKAGSKIAVQLCHAGLLAASNKMPLQVVAPSPVKYFGQTVTKELTVSEIEDIIVHFVKAAQRAKAAGFDGAEVHAAHNYLLAHFLSAAFNKRHDDFGGNVRNRARILVEIISRIRQSVGQEFPVWCRMNGIEYGIEHGLTNNEAKEIARMAENAGCDAIHVSAGAYGSYYGYNRACMGQPKGNLANLAGEIKKAVNVPVIAVGRIDLSIGEKLVRNAKADLIAIGRAHIADPHLVTKASQGRLDDIRPCISCNVCVDDLTTLDISLHCTVNACVGNEQNCKITKSQKVKRVLVVGGGPGGMEAAIVSALRGHDVTIYEKQKQLGGKLILAAIPPYKDEIRSFTNYLITQVIKSGVKVELEKEANVNIVKTFKPDVVILAAGANPIVPKILGINKPNVVLAEDVLTGKVVGQRVIIVGGGLVGCETAEFLAEKGKIVTIIEMLDEIAIGVGPSFKIGLLSRLKERNVTILTNAQCQEINDKGVVIIGKEGLYQIIDADTVVLSIGAKSNNGLFQSLEKLVKKIELVGDCVEPRRIINAISDGHRVGLTI